MLEITVHQIKGYCPVYKLEDRIVIDDPEIILERAFEQWKFDFVYHLAAEYGRWNGEDYYENLWQTNAIGTKHLIRLQEKLKFKMIFFSSAEVYGDYEGVMTEDVMEKNPIKDTYQMNDYAITKWAGELMCMNSAKMFGTETVRVRPVNCYGPSEHYTPYRGFILNLSIMPFITSPIPSLKDIRG
jgi:dTDP-glucose 4,6-dehydratase